jgi:hypothetical protein
MMAVLGALDCQKLPNRNEPLHRLDVLAAKH